METKVFLNSFFSITKINSYFSQQVLAKLFHIADTTLAKTDVDVTQTQFVNEVKIRTHLRLNKEPLLFNLDVSHLLFNKNRLQPYTDSGLRNELLSKPPPSIYPVNPTVSIFEQNIYRMEHLFRKKISQYFVTCWKSKEFVCVKFSSSH